MNAVEQAIVEHVAELTETQQKEVLLYVQQLAHNHPAAIMGDTLIALINQLGFDPTTLAEMEEAIESLCEQVEPISNDHLFT